MTVGVGVIGLGFMGATHVRAYASANAAGFANRLVAVADGNAERLAGSAPVRGNLGSDTGERLFDPSRVRGSHDPMGVIECPDVQLISICTPTDSHAELAIAAMERGKHVLIEKPVAISTAEVERVRDAAVRSGVLCMPAMCMRFWPGWTWLKRKVSDRSLGRVRSAVFTRLGTRPGWSDFYADDARCGGALFDLHIHDADIVRYLFGMPDEVVSVGTRAHVTTMYRYGRGSDGPVHVVAEGGWDNAEGFGFRMRYRVVFEEATAEFDLARSPRLMVSRDGRCEPVETDDTLTGYDGEIRAAVDAVEHGRPSPVDIRDTVGVTRLLGHELESLESGRVVRVGVGGP
ncbi:MAG: Gfo/Idh/MocA family oxidoreductase [Phycisphaeraceae bacterium]|nr:Gfo/Idh/MocA family oxidoreductase [Phycisphaerales bacterium]MCB9843157.1 Gfo/Idh/MocA family oxidoreductase [Phycisphaeraceae bacterium]